MTDLEDRLRAELSAFAERADPALIRPLRQPMTRDRSRARRWLAPATAVAAVTATITNIAFGGRLLGDDQTTKMVTGIPPSYQGKVPGLPPYYLILESGDPYRAVVH